MSLHDLAHLELVTPRDLTEACALLDKYQREGRRVWPLAGCTDWMVERHMTPLANGAAPGLAMDLTRLGELHGIQVCDDWVKIGAAETFSHIRRHPLLAERCPMLAAMAGEVGAIQIQNRGTLGGNLVSGSPAADGVTALMALDAQVFLRSSTQEHMVPIRSFFTGYRQSVRKPDELVVRFEFALPRPGAHQMWRKIGTRKAQAISKAAIAAVAELDHNQAISRIGLATASVAASVVALDSVRALVQGKRVCELDLAQVEAAVDHDIHPIDDLRSTERYRRHVVRTVVRRFFEAMLA